MFEIIKILAVMEITTLSVLKEDYQTVGHGLYTVVRRKKIAK